MRDGDAIENMRYVLQVVRRTGAVPDSALKRTHVPRAAYFVRYSNFHN
jgi:hypothetical protein